MGNSVSRVVGCFVPRSEHDAARVLFSEPLDEGLGHSFCYVRPALDSPSCSPTHHNSSDLSYSDRIGIDPDALDSGPLSTHEHTEDLQKPKHVHQEKPRSLSETSFKSISGASVSANNSTPRSILTQEQFTSFSNIPYERPSAFESTSSFTALPLQPIPKCIISTSGPISGSISGPFSGPLERGFTSGPIERGFMSGPLERGFMSGPLERGYLSGPLEGMDRSNFSGPFAFPYSGYIRRRKSLARFMKHVSRPVKRALSKTVSSVARTQRSLMVPVKELAQGEGRSQQGRDLCNESRTLQEFPLDMGYASSDMEARNGQNLQWAQGKAGEDRVHVVLSEEHGWLFVGIYDGFSGPDAPDFLMSNLYPAIYKELKGLLWDKKEAFGFSRNWKNNNTSEIAGAMKQPPCQRRNPRLDGVHEILDSWDKPQRKERTCDSQKVTETTTMCGSESKIDILSQKCSLKESFDVPDGGPLVVELDGKLSENGFCLDGERDVTAQTGDCQLNKLESKERTPQPERTCNLAKARSLLGGKLKHAYCRQKRENHRKLIHWRHDQDRERTEGENRMQEKVTQDNEQLKSSRSGLVDHSAVLRALARALETTEASYLEMADKAVLENPELALIGSCVLVMLMKDEDVYIMNVGDSRAVLAHHRKMGIHCRGQLCGQPNGYKQEDQERIGARDSMLRMELERIIEETPLELEALEASYDVAEMAPPAISPTLGALQLSSDHSTSIEEVKQIT